MKKILFLLILLPALCFSQKQESLVRYDIEFISADSFFLSETTIYKSAALARPDTLRQFRLFRDTAELAVYILRFAEDAETARVQADYFAAESDSLSERVKRLRKLAKDFFGIDESGKARAVLPPKSIEVNSEPAQGFWVVYPVAGKVKAEYVTAIEQITGQAIILNTNGTSMEFKPPKKPKKKK